MAGRRPAGVNLRINSDGSKSYEIRWRNGGGRNGRRLTHTFTRQADAAEALARIRAAGSVCYCPAHAPDEGPPVLEPTGGHLFGPYAHAHADALTGIGKGYRAQLHRDVDRHLAPFADRPLAGIGAREVREWIRGLEEGTHPWLQRKVAGTRFDYEPVPLSARTIRRLLVQAGSVLAAAVEEGLVSGNPFKGHRFGRTDTDRHTVMRLLTPDQWALVESQLPAGGYGVDLARMLVGTGLRFGEATALAVEAVDLLASPPVLHVRRAWKDDGAGGWELGPPKSARSRRTVELGPSVVDALAAHVVAKAADELVFTAPRGGPVRPANFFHRVWSPAVTRAMEVGLPRRPRLHDLRHTYASWQLAAGVPLFTVSRLLGHESQQVTSDIYGHLSREAGGLAVAAVEEAMSRGR